MTCRCWSRPCGWLASRTTGSSLISTETNLGLLITRSLQLAGREALFRVRTCAMVVRRCSRSQLGCAGSQRGPVLANSGLLCGVAVPTVPDVAREFVCRPWRCMIFAIDCCLGLSRRLLSKSPISDGTAMRATWVWFGGPHQHTT